MNLLQIILLLVVVELVNLASFYLGAYIAGKTKANEKIELPKIKTPMEVYKDIEAKHEENEREAQLKADLETINNYNGNI